MAIRRQKVETVEDMLRERWDVFSVCRQCGLTMAVDLRLVACVGGRTTSVWSRHPRRRRIGCIGVIDFQAKVPAVPWDEALDALGPNTSRRWPSRPEGGRAWLRRWRRMPSTIEASPLSSGSGGQSPRS